MVFTSMKKPKTFAQLKKILDAVVSKFVRIFYSDKNGMVACYTCGKVKHFSEQQCGHFIPRNILITRWELKNLRVQCVGCNMFGNGKILDFEDNLVKELGQQEVNELKQSRFKTIKLSSMDLEDRIAVFEKKLEKEREKLV